MNQSPVLFQRLRQQRSQDRWMSRLGRVDHVRSVMQGFPRRRFSVAVHHGVPTTLYTPATIRARERWTVFASSTLVIVPLPTWTRLHWKTDVKRISPSWPLAFSEKCRRNFSAYWQARTRCFIQSAAYRRGPICRWDRSPKPVNLFLMMA